MNLFRLQNNTPEVYSEESRDFQLLLRLYDCVVNGVKDDIDSMQYIINSNYCRNTILELLKTKVGFFTKEKFNDNILRTAISSFPLLVRNKGSLKSIIGAINTYLKAYNIVSEIIVWYTKEPTTVYGHKVPDHTVIVGLNSFTTDTVLLEEIFKYILPAGIGYYFYIFSKINTDEITKFETIDNANLLFVSDNINSLVRTSDLKKVSQGNDQYGPETFNDFVDHVLGAIDTVEIASTHYTDENGILVDYNTEKGYNVYAGNIEVEEQQNEE